MSSIALQPSSKQPTALYLLLVAMFPVLVPFYLFGGTPVFHGRSYFHLIGREPFKVESGVPQIADYLMVAMMALVIADLGFRFDRRLVTVVRAFAWFIGYVVCVNFIWTLLLQDPGLSLLRSCLFYCYDFLLFVTLLVLYHRFGDRVLQALLYGVAASVILQALLSPLALSRTQIRQSLFFNNFNQLGYFAVLAASLFFLGTRHFRVRAGIQLLFYTAVGYLAVISMSKAAIFAFVVLTALAVLKRPQVLFAGTALLAGTLVVSDLVPEWAEKFEQRLLGQHADESLEKRGYDRMLNHSEYLVFGAGEGQNNRFVSEHDGELHSTFGNVFFSYGIIGLTLFVGALITLVRRLPWGDAVVLLPPFAYGLAHQGLRFTLLWVLLAFLCCVAVRVQSVKEGAQG